MQYIAKNTTSTLCLTLTEKVTLTAPYFLVEMRSVESNITKTFISADTSQFTYRYNLLSVEEVAAGAEDAVNGKINLVSAGNYYYRVFEQTSPTNLSVANTTSLLEDGMFIVTTTTTDTATNSTTPETLVVHNIP